MTIVTLVTVAIRPANASMILMLMLTDWRIMPMMALKPRNDAPRCPQNHDLVVPLRFARLFLCCIRLHIMQKRNGSALRRDLHLMRPSERQRPA